MGKNMTSLTTLEVYIMHCNADGGKMSYGHRQHARRTCLSLEVQLVIYYANVYTDMPQTHRHTMLTTI